MRRIIIWLFLVLLANFIGFCQAKGTTFENFFCSVDQDGDGEIERHEATKFITKLDATVAGELPSEFNYGGKTICSEEMRDHLQNMLTPDRVVNWITHGLQLPQYADAFQKNAINGLDFLWLLENERLALATELGVSSPLHRSKITNAIIRQIFGFGSPPGPPLQVQCQSSTWTGIQLTWEPPKTLGYPPLHKYLVYRWSKPSSSWIPVADTKETSFLDIKNLFVGKAYSYRIQAWGGHGPSEWVTINNCTALTNRPLAFPAVSSGNMDKSKLLTTGRYNSDTSGDVVQGNTRWGWIFSVNGCLFLLGLLSRQGFFLRVALAGCVLTRRALKRLSLRIYEAQSSGNVCTRTLARGIVTVYTFYLRIHCMVFLLSKQARDERSACEALTLDKKILSRSDSYRNAIGYSTADCTVDDMLATIKKARLMACKLEAVSEGTKEVEAARNFVKMANKMSKRSVSAQSEISSTLSLSPSEENAADVPRTSSIGSSLRELEVTSQRKRTRHRCNFDGCKNRFDRWYYLTDWRMKFSKHYCRECQRVYCVKHTRISPHGPTGRCGLDSSCLCVNCFKFLSVEAQDKLERTNKLRAGPAVESHNGIDSMDPFPPDFRSLAAKSSSVFSNQDDASSGNSSSRSSCSSKSNLEEMVKEDLAR